MGVGILAAHQPDLLPWSGWWYKASYADVMDLAIHDQFQRPGYQNRVKMRGSWVTLPVDHDQKGLPIRDVVIDPVLWREKLIAVVGGRYGGSEFYDDRAGLVFQAIDLAADVCGERLWQFNLSLLLSVRRILGMNTPFAIGVEPEGTTVTARLANVCGQYGATTYLSGRGAREYLDLEAWQYVATSLRWSLHDPVSEDSILTLLFDYERPLQMVRRQTDYDGSTMDGIVGGSR